MLNIIPVKLKNAGSFIIFYETMYKKNLATFEDKRIEDIAKNLLNFFFSFIHKHINNIYTPTIDNFSTWFKMV